MSTNLPRFTPLLLPVGTAALALATHWQKLIGHVARAHRYWYDSIGHMYLSWERFQALTFQHGFFDFRWFYPYPNTGTYNEPAVSHGLLFGIWNTIIGIEPLAFNLAMVTIVLFNALALYLLLRDVTQDRWLSSIFAIAGGMSPFVWVRYAHPPNTIMFWGILGIFFLRRAARRAQWRDCLLAPACFVAQVFSSAYMGMFFLVPLLVLTPWTLATAYQRRVLKPFMGRCAAASAILSPSLWWLVSVYEETRRQLGTVNSYAYVSRYQRRDLDNFLPNSSFSCHLQAFGVHLPQEECWEELFPGGVLLASFGVSLTVFALRACRTVLRHPSRFPWNRFVRFIFVVASMFTAWQLGQTWPAHVGFWAALALPAFGERGTAWGLRSRMGVFLASLLLCIDIACNPAISIGDKSLESIHRFFFMLIPGFDGLRSEYRIGVLVPVFMAVVGALGLRWLTLLGLFRHRRWPLVLAAVPFGSAVVLEAQPKWQEFSPMPSSTEVPRVLEAARQLPDDAVLAAVRAKGSYLVRRGHANGNYFLGHIMLHKHPQITGYSTYDSPASEAIRRSALLPVRRDRLDQAARIAYLFGGTHLLIDWRGRSAPQRRSLRKMLGTIDGKVRLVARGPHLVLLALEDFPRVAHGPVPAEPMPGDEIRPTGMNTNLRSRDLKKAYDLEPRSTWDSHRRQRSGHTVTLRFDKARAMTGIGFAAGLRPECMPTAFAVDAWVDGSWQEVASIRRWQIPSTMIEEPLAGLYRVPFATVETSRLRLRITASSPWPWVIADTVGYHASEP